MERAWEKASRVEGELPARSIERRRKRSKDSGMRCEERIVEGRREEKLEGEMGRQVGKRWFIFPFEFHLFLPKIGYSREL